MLFPCSSTCGPFPPTPEFFPLTGFLVPHVNFKENAFHVFLIGLHVTPQKMTLEVPLSPPPPNPTVSNRRFDCCQGHAREGVSASKRASRLGSTFSASQGRGTLLSLEWECGLWGAWPLLLPSSPPVGLQASRSLPGGTCVFFVCFPPSPASPSVLYSCVSVKTRAPAKRKTLFMRLPRLGSHIISIALRYTQLTTYANFRQRV